MKNCIPPPFGDANNILGNILGTDTFIHVGGNILGTDTCLLATYTRHASTIRGQGTCWGQTSTVP